MRRGYPSADLGRISVRSVSFGRSEGFPQQIEQGLDQASVETLAILLRRVDPSRWIIR